MQYHHQHHQSGCQFSFSELFTGMLSCNWNLFHENGFKFGEIQIELAEDNDLVLSQYELHRFPLCIFEIPYFNARGPKILQAVSASGFIRNFTLNEKGAR
jgi:hypothetical protein